MRILMAAALAATTTLAGAAFTTTASAQAGSYTGSCRNISNNGGQLSAECADTQGRYRSTSIPAGACRGDIGNQNGVLACNGAQGTVGPYLTKGGRNGGAPVFSGGDYNGGGHNGGGYNGGDNRDRDRNRGDGANAAAAIVGALVGADLYQQGHRYPTYGQAGYGDPRYDARFADGGWGAGYRGQWVPMDRRADWLDRRIDRGVQDGTLSRRQAQRLRDQLDDLVNLEHRYERRGLDDRERADLDWRFDNLAAQIRFASNNGSYGGYDRPYGGYGGDHGYNH